MLRDFHYYWVRYSGLLLYMIKGWGPQIISLYQVILLNLIFINSFTYSWTGYLDNVKCFFCDGGLCNWEADDEPWTEHARWFPDCGFLKQVKGMTFIQKVKVSTIFAYYYHTIGRKSNN